MALYRPTQLLEWLQQHELAPRKGLSQNFLIDRHIVDKIIATAQPKQRVIEIGPGPGVVTEQLLSAGLQVVAIETDPQLCKLLPRLGPLEAVEADALRFDWPGFFARYPGERFVLISNLPYHLSTPLLRLLLPMGGSIERLIVMVQQEFAQRVLAKPGSKKYGPLSVLQQYYSRLHTQFKVPARCFYPRPHVESCVLRLDLIERDPATGRRLECLLERGFSQRRKCLSSLLSIAGADEQVQLLKAQRAEQLTLDQWLALNEKLAESQSR